jgi:hypothetical protein
MSSALLNQYSRVLETVYREERYLVRDNGAVQRQPRAGGRKRPLDGEWTFGKPSDFDGYMHIGNHVVHRIVAYAYLGEPPTDQHVVDHIDTIRRNNRPENLRWVTRLENAISNPITRQRIIFAYGSVEAFIENPRAPKNELPQSFDWMRTVTPEEARNARTRLESWAASGQAPKGGRLGEWLFSAPVDSDTGPSLTPIADLQSDTPMATQRGWRTVCEFPACPESASADPLGEYLARLTPESVFTRNRYGESIVVEAARLESFLSVVNKQANNSVKPFAVARVIFEGGKFVHEGAGQFFTLDGALKYHCQLTQQLDRTFEPTIDDFA